MRKTDQRGMTIIEMVISLGIMLLILGFTTLLFKQAFTHNTLTTENMTNEQLARVGLAKVANSIAQASEDTNSGDIGSGTPAPAVISTWALATAAPAVVFYRVAALAPAAGLLQVNGHPDPSYYVHIISYDGVSNVNEYVVIPSQYNVVPSPAPRVIATNVTDFQVQPVNGNPDEYRLSITVSNILNPTEAEKPFTLVDNVHIMK